MSFPDVGRLVTPEEVTSFVAPMNNTIGVLETVVIESVEDMVEDYCERKFELQTFEDEQYFIKRPSVTFDQMTVVPRLELRLKNRPVVEFTELKQVIEHSQTTGEPVNPQAIQRNLYTVDLQSGIVIFAAPVQAVNIVDSPLMFLGGFPGNPYIELLATYDAGFATADIPKRLKLAVLMAIYRVYVMTIKQNWHRTESQTAGAMTIWESYIREECGLTPEEKMILNRFKTPAAA